MLPFALSSRRHSQGRYPKHRVKGQKTVNSHTITRREFIKGTGALAGGLVLGSRLPGLAAQPDRKPNIVFIFADQLRAQALGCYGDKQAKTPNIDRLAAQGCRFDNAISTWPVCSPFRGMLLTGRYPMSNGVVENNRPLWDNQPTIATVLKSHGYNTGYIGKWHLNGAKNKNVPPYRRMGFDYWVEIDDQPILSNDKDGRERWRPEEQTKDAVAYIKQQGDKPFCLFVSWNPPHNPYVAPDRYEKMFPPEKMEFRPNVAEKDLVAEQLAKHPISPGSPGDRERKNWRRIMDTDSELRGILSGYYAATTGLDACIGQILKALDEQGIADDTILVFSSDHGDMIGSHRMCLKQEPFEESIRIPFIVRYPRKIAKGTVTDALLSPIDIMPTLLSLAGVPIPETVEGISIAEAALGKRSDQQDAVLIMKMVYGGGPWIINAATPWRGVRTKTHTYARLQDDGPWVLFDNKADPYQMKNLIDDPAHAKLRDELESKMQSLLKKAHDPFDAAAINKIIDEQSKTKLIKPISRGKAGGTAE